MTKRLLPVSLVAVLLGTASCNLDFSTIAVEAAGGDAAGTDSAAPDTDDPVDGEVGDGDAADSAVDTDPDVDMDDATELDDTADASDTTPVTCPTAPPGYGYARALTVSTGATPVEAGYSVVFELPAATLQAEGKVDADSTDLRVVFCRDGAFEELPLAIDPSVFASQAFDAVPIWFALQEPIAADGTDDRYRVVYGDPTQTVSPLWGWRDVFLFSGVWSGDERMPLPPDFSVQAVGAGSATVQETGLAVTAATPEAAVIVSTAGALPADRGFAVRQLFTHVSASDSTLPGMSPLALFAPGPDSAAPVPGSAVAYIGVYATVGAHVLTYLGADGATRAWTSSGWSTEVGAVPPVAGDVPLTYELFSDGDRWRLVVSDAGLTTTHIETASVAWGETSGTDADLWLGFGDASIMENRIEGLVGYTWVRRYVTPEPTVELGAEVTP